LNLFEVVGVSNQTKEDQNLFFQKFIELVWTLFFTLRGEELLKEDKKEFMKAAKNDPENFLERLVKRFPTMKTDLLTCSLKSKALVIEQNILKLVVLLEKSNVQKKNVYVKKLQSLSKLIEQEEWESFSQFLPDVYHIRKELHD